MTCVLQIITVDDKSKIKEHFVFKETGINQENYNQCISTADQLID